MKKKSCYHWSYINCAVTKKKKHCKSKNYQSDCTELMKILEIKSDATCNEQINESRDLLNHIDKSDHNSKENINDYCSINKEINIVITDKADKAEADKAEADKANEGEEANEVEEANEEEANEGEINEEEANEVEENEGEINEEEANESDEVEGTEEGEVEGEGECEVEGEGEGEVEVENHYISVGEHNIIDFIELDTEETAKKISNEKAPEVAPIEMSEIMENPTIIGACITNLGKNVNYQLGSRLVSIERDSKENFPDSTGGYRYKINPSLTDNNYIVQIQRDYGILGLPRTLRDFNYTSIIHNKTPSSFIVTFLDPYGIELDTKVPHTIILLKL